ncbi:MAG TPA: radical SAM protein [Actinomycetota bacterium]|nr:radical SAM protein [Actinomycetota bacterium]
MSAVGEAINAGRLPGRVWLYSNYHCNLACSYCLTESAPDVSKRRLGAEHMVAIAHEAVALGFNEIGVTGGEPFLEPDMPEIVARLAEIVPVVVLTNGTLFTRRRLERMAPLGGADVRLQISLDSSDPVANDTMRGPENFRKVVEAIPRLVDMGIKVRVASTLEYVDKADLSDLCSLHRRLGVPDEDHIVRPIVRRGRAVDNDMGIDAAAGDLPPELTITADGAFWSAFGPTVHGGKLDTDLLVTRTTSPLRVPAATMLRLLEDQPAAVNGDAEFI